MRSHSQGTSDLEEKLRPHFRDEPFVALRRLASCPMSHRFMRGKGRTRFLGNPRRVIFFSRPQVPRIGVIRFEIDLFGRRHRKLGGLLRPALWKKGSLFSRVASLSNSLLMTFIFPLNVVSYLTTSYLMGRLSSSLGGKESQEHTPLN